MPARLFIGVACTTKLVRSDFLPSGKGKHPLDDKPALPFPEKHGGMGRNSAPKPPSLVAVSTKRRVYETMLPIPRPASLEVLPALRRKMMAVHRGWPATAFGVQARHGKYPSAGKTTASGSARIQRPIIIVFCHGHVPCVARRHGPWRGKWPARAKRKQNNSTFLRGYVQVSGRHRAC
jgi:hypothetical protein